MSRGPRRARGLAAAALALGLGGCVTYGDLLVDPRTDELQACRATGWGGAGARRATVERHVCLATLRSLGFRPLRVAAPLLPLQAP